MRIAFLSFYSGLVDRGWETVVDQLAKGLVKKKWQVMVVVGGKPSSSFAYQVATIAGRPAVNVNPIGLKRKLLLDANSLKIAWFSLKALQVLISFKPRVVFVGNGGWQTLIMKLYCLIFGAKLVVSGQAGLGWDDRFNLFLKPNLFIALSRRNYIWAKKHCWPKQKMAVIPNGVDLDCFKPKNLGIKKPLFLKNLPKPIILCVAGAEKYKRVIDTIKAIACLKKASLLLVCASSIYDKQGRTILGKRFIRKSFRHDFMPKIYQSADVFTLVSQASEAFGVVFLEALASNLPIVTIDESFRREIIGKGGIFIKDSQNSGQYALAIKKALKQKWHNLPRKQAEKFSWQMVVNRYNKSLKELL